MTLIDFIATYLGRYVQAPGGLGGQCVDLLNEYIVQVLKGDPIRANASDWARKSLPHCSWFANNPTNYPARGAIVVWGAASSVGIGVYGHIALTVCADRMRLLTLDQNWADRQYAAFVFHDYEGVLGWWMPRAQITA